MAQARMELHFPGKGQTNEADMESGGLPEGMSEEATGTHGMTLGGPVGSQDLA